MTAFTPSASAPKLSEVAALATSNLNPPPQPPDACVQLSAAAVVAETRSSHETVGDFGSTTAKTTQPLGRASGVPVVLPVLSRTNARAEGAARTTAAAATMHCTGRRN